MIDKSDWFLREVAETVYEEEGLFYITINADKTELPLEGMQRLVMGGRATPSLAIGESGIDVSLSINRVHYDILIPWSIVSAVEGNDKAFFCRRDDDEGDMEELSKKGDAGNKKKTGHLKLVK